MVRKPTYELAMDDVPVAIIQMDYSPLLALAKDLQKQTVTNIRQYLYENQAVVKKTYRKVTVLDANREAMKLFHVSKKKDLSASLQKVFTKTALDLLIEQFISLLEGEKQFTGEIRHTTQSRKSRDVFVRLVIPRKFYKSYSRVVLTLQDITNWKKLERQLRKRAQLDGLTRLLNHSTVMQRLEDELLRSKRYGLSLSCMMIDLDFFKVINDKFGHQRGDQILKRVSRMVFNCFRKVDIVGRYGGDEFLIILPETKPQLAKYAAQRLQRIFSKTMFKYKRVITFHITLSIGIAGYPAKNVKDAKDLAALADKAMYACKMAGRNRIQIAS